MKIKYRGNKNTNNRKKEAIAVSCTLAILAVGTFAWQAFSQTALNESSHMFQNPGGRLHDDYNGENKDIYVENFTGEQDGVDIFARIRIDEYMEYGEGAGTLEPVDVTLLRGNILHDGVPLIGDVSTWDTYDYDSEADPDNESIRTYRNLAFGGQTVYMPTFNKNQNNLNSDINGTYAGPDGDRVTDYDRYGDYVTYDSGEISKPTDALYAVTGNPDADHVVENQVHTARETLDAKVISMEDWMDRGSPIGDYWVYDVDGWAYWADAIEPDTATGLLLDEVVVTEDYDGEWYYAINVVAQLATAGDWGDLPSGNNDVATGMYEGGMTANGQLLLNKISSTDTQLDGNYFEEEGGVAVYFNDVQSQFKNVSDPGGIVRYNLDHQGDKISLYAVDGLDEGSSIATISEEDTTQGDVGYEVEFDYGISMAGNNVCFTFTDLKMYGYESFTAYFGTHYIARFVNSTATSFTFEIRLDGETAYKSDMFTAYSPMEYVDIDLRGSEVFQIILDTNGVGTGDYAAIGDPIFHKESASPYMDVFDLEYNSPHQVTESNLLYYADAWDIDLTNLSDKITYKTDYVEGGIGEYSVTYSVTGATGKTTEQTVKLTVTGDDYTDAWTMEDYKTPYVNYMYHPRNTLAPQQRKLFDLAMKSVLDFNPNGGENYSVGTYTKWGETVYELKLDLQAAGIFIKKSEFNTTYFNTITDADPRAYIFKQWTTTDRYTSDSETGMLKTYHVFISKSWADAYDTMIPKIIANSERFLAYAKDDMTDVQKLYYVTTPYKDWISYNDGGFLVHALGQGYAKCGGNSMGVVHLAQRLGILSLYGQVYTSSGELHAATYQKLVDEDGWYMCDKLWAKQWTAPLLSGFSLSRRGGYGWIDYAETSISSYKYTAYPSIWLSFGKSTLTMEQGEKLDLMENITSIGSVFNVTPSIEDIVTVSVKDESGNTVTSDPSKLSRGTYTIHYDIYYKDSSILTVERNYEVKLLVYETTQNVDVTNSSSLTLSSSNVHGWGSKGLYNATTKTEEYYYGVDINNGGFITLDNTEGYNAITVKFGPKTYCRNDSWAAAYCKVALYVYFDGVLQTNTATLTAFSNYASVEVYIPDGVSEIKLFSRDVGGSAGHATIADIKLYK